MIQRRCIYVENLSAFPGHQSFKDISLSLLSLGNDRDRVLSPYCLLSDADSTTAPGVPDSHLNADEPNAQDCFSLVVQNNSFGAPTTYVQSKMHNKNLRL